jgi:Protein of unknown function (DUF2905)
VDQRNISLNDHDEMLLWPWLGRLGLGRLPGDIVIERETFRFYFPIVTCLVASGVVSLILWLLNR